MSKITNDGITWSSTECSVPIWQQTWRQRVKIRPSVFYRRSKQPLDFFGYEGGSGTLAWCCCW